MSICSVALLPAGVVATTWDRKVHDARHGYGSHTTQEQLVFLPGLLDLLDRGGSCMLPMMLHR